MRVGRYIVVLLIVCRVNVLLASDTLPNTQPLTIDGDIASQLVAGVDRFLLREIGKSHENRQRFWQRDLSSPGAYSKSIEHNRRQLAHILGARDPRVEFDAPELVATTDQPALVGRGADYDVYAIRWPAFGDVYGEGLLLVPKDRPAVANIVALPDANQAPEQLVGLAAGIAPECQFARRLAESGCRVAVPLLINRTQGESKKDDYGGAGLSNREFLYRSAYQLGRGLGGYETLKIQSLVDWFAKSPPSSASIGIIGYGEGGRLALLAAALDPRIQSCCVSGYFGNRDKLWEEPIDRNVFGLLERFGDAELAAMVAPRALIVEAAKAPEINLSGEGGGAPARIVTANLDEVNRELARAIELVKDLEPEFQLVVSDNGQGLFGTNRSLAKFLSSLNFSARLAAGNSPPENLRPRFDPAARHARQMHEIDRHNQLLLASCDQQRDAFFKKLDTSSPNKFHETIEPYRKYFYDEVIGRFDQPMLPANPRSRKIDETTQWTRYEIVLDVFPEVIAYGLLTIPKAIKPGDKRPVVVCQHGLEGRPQHTIGKDGSEFYSAFATRLAERGYITFAPQNLYIFGDRFRSLQRKANPVKKTLFSIIVPQHQQITDWLKTLPEVDPAKIAFYGLSYGGKSAMRIPPLVQNYCLSICSGDFNEWIRKTTSTLYSWSYPSKGEYEMFEFDLANTFNYAEMAMLIAPRPFMVERGRRDGVATDEWVGYEFAKVLRFYDAQLGLPNRCEIEWFNGPHKINGQRTYDFLDEQLRGSSK